MLEPAKKKSILVDGIRTSYIDLGAGETIVALHGIPTSSALFEPLLPFLTGYHVIAPDMLGQGDTEAPATGSLGFSAYCRHVDAFLKTVAPASFHLLVHDLGGVIGLGWACDNPERVRSITVLSTTITWSFRVGVLAYAANLLLGERLIRWAVSSTLKGPNRLDESLIEAWARPWSRHRVLRGLDHFSVSHLRRLRSKLPEIRAPVLVTWGERDNIFPLSHARRLSSELPGSKLVTIPRCGHWSPVDAPEQVAEYLVPFLKSIQM